ncbi:bacteriocin fulvocin C-related protein [Kordia sp. YSTF-M3]|uniref:Bacteriocin fulvocin C-related protein n=1 Tax=Kordia aestuariivivens TaxID=2759037 RepID=A0ABR7Q3W9_9FLAO|nr:bacteriocin fulvocin C-related protein [Kordia aestuariivivens]MBC8753251.1 bacteriocin fulvocin C-related protein [Kordia aestuariivivens]
MKRTILLILVAQFFLIGCNQEEVCYSCDESVDAFVKENLKAIQLMNRADIINYSKEKQRGIYRALSADKKKEIWQDKFVQINSLDLSDGERALMNKFQEFVNKKDFSSPITHKETGYLNSLRETGIQKFGWTQRFVVSAFGYLENIDRSGIIVARDGDGDPVFTDPDPKPDCDCDWGLGCLDGPCDGRDGACDKTETGCGFLFFYECVSLCRPDLG